MKKYIKFFMRKFILLIFLSFQIVNSIDIEKINFEGKEIESKIENNSAIKYYRVNIKKGNPNYLRILIQDEDKNSTVNHIISFYQKDSKYIKRKQLSQSLNYETELFLNKGQMGKEFYFTVECDQYPCFYKYIISGKDNIEINLEDRYSYTYYVTEETKQMNFKIKGKPESTSNNRIIGENVVTVWAKGNKKIISELNAKNSVKNSEFEAYLVKLEKLDQFEYDFKVKGEVGDLINIGVSFFDGTYHNFYYNTVSGNIKEFSGFLKKGIKEVNCFKIEKSTPGENNEDGFISFTNNNNYDVDLMSITTLFGDNRYFKRCLSILDADEGFYSFQFIGQNYENSANIYPPQIIGKEYTRYILEGDTIQLIPIKPDYDYTYMTFKVNMGQGKKINAYINSCKTYPLCDVSPETLEKSIKIQSYNSFSISYTKKEIDSFSSSPIAKKQKILLIHCETGSRSYFTAKTKQNFCLIKVNIYTDKNEFYLEPYVSHYRYIPKNNEDNFIIGLKNNIADYMVMNLELFSGKYSLTLPEKDKKDYEQYNLDKKFLYIFKDKERSIKIKALENSFYHLNYILKNKYAVDYTFTIGANYLFNLGKKEYENILFAHPNFIEDIDRQDINMIIDFYPHNCDIQINKTFTSGDQDQSMELVEANGFYQDITDQRQDIRKILPAIFPYTIINKDVSDNCLVDVSYFKYDADNDFSKVSDNGIMLNTNSSKDIFFPSKDHIIKCAYPHIGKNKTIIIDFEIEKNENYLMNIFLSDEVYKLEYKIENNTSIVIEPSEFANSTCKSKNQICKLSLNIKSQNDEPSSLRVMVSTIGIDDEFEEDIDEDEEEESDEKEDDDDSKLTLVICIVSIIVGVALIIFLVLYLYKRSNRKLAENISTVSFGDKLNDGDTKEALLNNL